MWVENLGDRATQEHPPINGGQGGEKRGGGEVKKYRDAKKKGGNNIAIKTTFTLSLEKGGQPVNTAPAWVLGKEIPCIGNGGKEIRYVPRL